MLGRWVAIERSRLDDPPTALDADERAELNRLRVEVSELRMDREFLKKATAQAYAARKTAEGHSKLEIIRCLKRYLAREVYYLLNPGQPPGTAT